MKNFSLFFSILSALALSPSFGGGWGEASAQVNLTLSTPQTQGGTITAASSIILKPGFSFAASSGTSLTLKLDANASTPYGSGTPSLSQDQNYILTRTYKNGEGTGYIDEIKYFDGLGRPVQIVQPGITPSGADLATYQEYDGFGRESKSWLPSVVAGNGAFQPLSVMQTNAPSANAGDTQPYSYPVYEASPLNRVLQQFGPGADWHTKNKAVATDYLTNTTSGVLACDLLEVTSEGNLKKTDAYPQNSLYVTKTTDEDGNASYEFKDKLGQVVLTRQVNEGVNYDTYYVFDDFGKPRFVLPPMASAQFTANGAWNLDNQTLKDYAYIYKYDGRLRCTWKKIPGCDPIYYVYDRADRLVLSQDGEQRKTGSWTFNKYDALGRVVITGVHTSERSHESWINLCKDLVVTESKGGNYGYSWNSLPEIPFTGTLLVNHYDDYEHLLNQDQAFRDKLSYTAEADYGTRYENSSCASCSAKGLLVGTRAAVMGGGGEIVTAIYYDSRGRVIQTKSTNLLGGTEAEYTAYDFTGHPTKRKHVHTTSSATTTELYAYTYDHAGRLLKTTHGLNGGTAVTLAENTYDELGRLKTSKPGSNESLKLTYDYNVRSWLTNIAGQKLTERLYYNIPFESGTPRYNGNISTAMWNLWDYYLGFNYTYDNLSRLTAGQSFLRWEGDAPGTSYGAYDTWYRYDRNGNMTALSRLEDLSLEEVDISHSGNQISRITNKGDLYPDYYSGFVSYSDGSAYAYNANGAMTSDPDKGAQYAYNAFGMPSQVKVPAILGTIDYKYSATGERLEASYKWHSGLSLDPQENVNRPTYTATNSSKLRQYVGNKVYENGSLKRILFDNGCIEGGIYYFYLRDHLGNNSVVAKADGQVVQRNHYYPYGKTIDNGESWGQAAQPYKFGGKEEETMFGLELYDFHARQMDRRTGEFLGVDPLCEKYYSISPYAYCAGNPVNAVDVDGRKILFVNGYWSSGIIGDLIGSNSSGAGYWGTGFSNQAQKFFNDFSPISSSNYIDGSSKWGGDMSGQDRYDAGYAYAKANLESLSGGLKDGETFKMVTHSEGSAYGAGLSQYLLDKGYKVETIVHLSADEGDEFSTPKAPMTYQLAYNGDWVTGNKIIQGVDKFGLVANSLGSTEVHGTTKDAGVFKLVSDLKTVQYQIAIGGSYNWYHSWYYQSPGTTINGTEFTNINGYIIQYYNGTAK